MCVSHKFIDVCSNPYDAPRVILAKNTCLPVMHSSSADRCFESGYVKLKDMDCTDKAWIHALFGQSMDCPNSHFELNLFYLTVVFSMSSSSKNSLY